MLEDISFIASLINIFKMFKSFLFRKKETDLSNKQTNTTVGTNNTNTYINIGNVDPNGVINVPSLGNHTSEGIMGDDSLKPRKISEFTPESRSVVAKDELVFIIDRSDLKRIIDAMDSAKATITIVSINYVFARNCMGTLINATKRGVKVRLIALDPNCEVLPYFTINTNVSEESKKDQIVRSYEDIENYLSDNPMIEARYVDRFFTCGCIGIDTSVGCSEAGELFPSWIYLFTYLYNVGVAQSPVIGLHYPNGSDSGNKFVQYIENLWDSAN